MLSNCFYKSRKGIAIPVVLLIVLCVMVMTISVVHFRKESKKQNVNNFHFLRVNFLAQSAVQQMLLKLSVLPQEAYDSGVLSLGYCPFRGIVSDGNTPLTPGHKNDAALKVFFEDCKIDTIPWQFPQDRMPNPSNSKYKVNSLNIMNAYNDTSNKKTYLTAKIIAVGEGKMEKGNAGFRKEQLEKVIQLTGAN